MDVERAEGNSHKHVKHLQPRNMGNRYLLQRRLRHLRSVTLCNVALQVDKRLEGQESVHRETVTSSDCFYVIEDTRGSVLFVSEVQGNAMRQLQFNDVQFGYESGTRFLFKIAVQVPHEFASGAASRGGEPPWCYIRECSIDLNHLKPIDVAVDTVVSLNMPVFRLDDGCYTLPEAQVDRGAQSIHSRDRSADHMRLQTAKKSFSFNTVLKLNKLLEYRDQVHAETARLSQRLEAPLNASLERFNNTCENGQHYKHQLERTLAKKRADLEALRREMEAHETMARSNTASSVDITRRASINDEYGTTYSALFQTRDSIMNLRSKKLVQLARIFRIMGFFELAAKLDCKYCAALEGNGSDSWQFKLDTIDIPALQRTANKSLETQELVNTFLGYYLLLLVGLSENIFSVKVPYRLMFYGSTSLIDKVHPLYLPEAYAAYNQERFHAALKLFNINIQQINQYLIDHYTNV